MCRVFELTCVRGKCPDKIKMSTRRHAILFGLNYQRTPKARLRGCINDIHNMARVLRGRAFDFGVIRQFADNVSDPRTTKAGILEELRALSERSHADDLEVAWIHYSGHGSGQRDEDGDELDRTDECLVPSDYDRSGLIRDDEIKAVLRTFNPSTRVVCVFDCCHSGTIGDLKYHYFNRRAKRVENHAPPCPAKVLMISGCMDSQTSADAFNVNKQRKFSGAMSSCLIQSFRRTRFRGPYPVFDLMDALRAHLVRKRFKQVPQLTSSYEIPDDEVLL